MQSTFPLLGSRLSRDMGYLRTAPQACRGLTNSARSLLVMFLVYFFRSAVQMPSARPSAFIRPVALSPSSQPAIVAVTGPGLGSSHWPEKVSCTNQLARFHTSERDFPFVRVPVWVNVSPSIFTANCWSLPTTPRRFSLRCRRVRCRNSLSIHMFRRLHQAASLSQCRK